MAETVKFTIPAPVEGQEPPYLIVWYQSDNGEIWDLDPVDTIVVDNLILDVETGEYSWVSDLADPLRYHLLKMRTLSGQESTEGLFLPPRTTPEGDTDKSTVIANRIFTGIEEYKIGDKVDLILELDKIAAEIIGSTINVHILDYFNNPISTVQASAISNTTYVAEYTIPNNLDVLFNPYKDQYEFSFYVLKDRWLIPDSTGLEYSFKILMVSKEQPIVENAKIKISLDGVIDTNSNPCSHTEIEFTTKLNPYYSTTESVIKIFRQQLGSLPTLDIAKEIVDWSRHVDMHMRPDQLKSPSRYENAVSEYVTYKAAISLLNTNMNLQSEMKQLDTFQVSRTYADVNRMINKLEELAQAYENIIYAGGLDNPYMSRNFVKGLNDPNRPSVGRAVLYLGDIYPYVNMTTDSTVVNVDGNDIEIRGARTIGYRNLYSTSLVRLNEIAW